MKKGFTILELLVVISVLVILIGIAIPRFKGMQDAGRIAQVKAELKTLQTAVESYYMNASPNAYPANTNAALTGATPQIIATQLYDPFGATSTTGYLYSTVGKYYVISSVGPGNGAQATVDSSGNITNAGSVPCVSNAANTGTSTTSC